MNNNSTIFNNAFIDGCFDVFHYGHVHALFQSKQKCKKLSVATHSDIEILKAKSSPPLFNYEERYNMLKNCKFVDILYEQVPYNTTVDIIESFGCEVFCHGEDGIDKYPLIDIKNANKLHVYNRTNGISTSDIVSRILDYKNGNKVKTNMDRIYQKYLFDKINSTNLLNENSKIIILKCSWDMINTNHINLIHDIKEKYKDYNIVVDLLSDDNSYDIFNKYEMGITLLGIKGIDKVLLYSNANYDFKDIILINTQLVNGKIDNSFNNQIEYINKYKYNFLNNIDITLYSKKIKHDFHTIHDFTKVYFDILEIQFNSLLDIFKKTMITQKDHVIFDIDEVCLCNLMYHGIEISAFNNETYNYDNGIIPINKECKKLFDFIHYNNIKYSFITGRKDYIRQITQINLKLEGLDKYEYLYTCPNDYIGNIKDYKEKCRKEIVDKGYNIIFCIGDQLSDIIGKNVGTPFLIFNPFYITK